jgi:hypothetical protein
MDNQVIDQNTKPKFPTETITLPSKGLIYPQDNPLSSGKIEMKYMTAKEEDILTNENYIKQGIVFDKLLQSLIISPINYDDLIIGDKNALLIAARILGYGKDYNFKYNNDNITVDLTELAEKHLDDSLITPNTNEFHFELPHSKNKITFKILTSGDEKKIDSEIKNLKRINKNISAELSTRMKHIITSIEGDSSTKTIRDFIDNYLLAKDSQALREYIKKIQPNIELVFDYDGPNGLEEEIALPLTANFFWPSN